VENVEARFFMKINSIATFASVKLESPNGLDAVVGLGNDPRRYRTGRQIQNPKSKIQNRQACPIIDNSRVTR
jgi:hypothetical protein